MYLESPNAWHVPKKKTVTNNQDGTRVAELDTADTLSAEITAAAASLLNKAVAKNEKERKKPDWKNIPKKQRVVEVRKRWLFNK